LSDSIAVAVDSMNESSLIY